jgi:hypothetical protein
MAKVDMKMPEDFLLILSALGERTDEIIHKILEAGGEVVLAAVRSNLEAVSVMEQKKRTAPPANLCGRSVYRPRNLTATVIPT